LGFTFAFKTTLQIDALNGRVHSIVFAQGFCRPPNDLEAVYGRRGFRANGSVDRMSTDEFFTDPAEVERDLILLENVRRARKEFMDRICAASQSDDEQALALLRTEPCYQMAEFFYLLRARGIESVDAIEALAELHNQYIVELMKDPAKVGRLGLNAERLLDAMFTADTMPRLLQTWREQPGTIDQSNLARLLVGVMSTETCRKVVVACATAGFLTRERTPYGTIVVSSRGQLERVFGSCFRDLRGRIGAGR
jgi:hypothetical protein